jgi:anti-sigma B factor antagonist
MSGTPEYWDIEHVGDTTVVKFRDKTLLDEQQIQALGEQLFALVDQIGRGKMLLNLGSVEYFSSAALGKLVTLNKKLRDGGGQLILCNIDPQIEEVFTITRLNKLFRIQRYPDEDPDDHCGGVGAQLKPRRPSGDGSVALPPPPSEWGE